MFKYDVNVNRLYWWGKSVKICSFKGLEFPDSFSAGEGVFYHLRGSDKRVFLGQVMIEGKSQVYSIDPTKRRAVLETKLFDDESVDGVKRAHREYIEFS